MTEKHDAPAIEQEDSATHEDARQAKRSLGFLWLLLAATAIGAGLWAIDQGHLDRLMPAEQEETLFTPPPSPRPAPEVTQAAAPALPLPKAPMPKETPAQPAEMKAAKREYAKLRRDIDQLKAEISTLNENIKNISEAIEKKQENTQTSAEPVMMQAAVEGEKLREQVMELTRQLEQLRQDYERRDGRHSAQLKLAQVLDSIENRLNAGEPFAQEMRRLQGLSMQLHLQTDAVDMLQDVAQRGIMPLSELLATFSESAQLALPYALDSKDSPDLMDGLRGNLAHLISIRKVEVATEDNSDEAHIARAESELQAGNVDMALSHLEQLSDEPRSIFYEWQGEAQAHLDAHRAVARLKSAALQQTGGE